MQRSPSLENAGLRVVSVCVCVYVRERERDEGGREGRWCMRVVGAGVASALGNQKKR